MEGRVVHVGIFGGINWNGDFDHYWGGVVAGVTLNKSKANGGGWVVITLAWGLAVTMGVFAVGNYSGAHLNPAVTFAFAITGDFPWKDVPMYILAQMLGAIIGAAIVFFTIYLILKQRRTKRRNSVFLQQFRQLDIHFQTYYQKLLVRLF